MGRNKKQGLDYFPFDVDFFQDLKIRKLIKYQGGKAIGVYALLLCNIYKQGYYIVWDEELPFIISETTGCDEAYIREVIKCCLVVGLFSDELFHSAKVLTSAGIQSRYRLICELARRKAEMSDFVISSEFMPISSEEKAISSEEKAINSEKSTQSKVKESKRNNLSLLSGNKRVARDSGNERERERERKIFYDIFFFRNAKDPDAETAKFINYYSATDWKRNGEPITDKIALAKMWKITEGGRFPEKFLTMWESFYARLWAKDGDSEGTRRMVTDIYAVSVRENAVTLTVSPELQDCIEQSLNILRPLWRENYQGCNLQYITKN